MWNESWGKRPDPDVTFTVNQTGGEVILEGGYAYTDPDLNPWDVEANPTILSGDLAGDDGPDTGLEEDISNNENVWHVLTVFGLTDASRIDGLTIERGNIAEIDNHDPSNPYDSEDIGAGIYLTAPLVPETACDVPVQHTVTFAQPYIQNCTIQYNAADTGGGIAAMRHKPFGPTSPMPSLRIRTCTIRANRADWYGAGIAVANGKLDMAGTLVVGNEATHQGGGILLTGGSCTPSSEERVDACIVNCTISQNRSFSGSGAGLYVAQMNLDSEVSVQSSILALNAGALTSEYTDITHQVSDDDSMFDRIHIEFVNSAIPDGDIHVGCHNVAAGEYSVLDPYFVNSDWEDPVAERDYHLTVCSPLRDLGQEDESPYLLPRDVSDVDHNGQFGAQILPAWSLDADGPSWEERVRDSRWVHGDVSPVARVDIGALEHDQPFECPIDLTGDGQVNGADMSVLLGAWSGTCSFQGNYNHACDLVDRDAAGLPNPCFCADYNRDGVVDGADLTILLGAWGPCPGCPYPPCEGGGESMMAGGSAEYESVSFVTPTDLAAMYGFEALGAFSEWVTAFPPAVRDAILAPLMPWPVGGPDGGE